MDILKEIKGKLSKVSDEDRPKGINAVLAHIEISEKYYVKGIAEKDEHYFTDVIYRTNHAFEGILKEAYEVIQEQNASNKSPYEIEQFLADNDLLNARVMQLFINYRQNWRNPSTHDYQLFFGSQEAFLAIVTVSSFVNVLLDQIVEKLAYKSAKLKSIEHVTAYKSGIKGYSKLSLMNKVSQILRGYCNYFQENFAQLIELPEPELLGGLKGYISAFEPNWKISTNQIIAGTKSKINPDMVIDNNKDKFIVQFKRSGTENTSLFYGDISAEYEQLSNFLSNSEIKQGVVLHTPHKKGDAIITGHVNSDTLREVYSIEDSMLPNEENEENEENYQLTKPD
ncbi:hypothetical protein OAH87_00860 [Marinomonas sp.]|nr:hypothetical protein [Marinomonas sp.]MDB4837004.1 hypothetical protein [Marinomonas sp.]